MRLVKFVTHSGKLLAVLVAHRTFRQGCSVLAMSGL